MIYKKTVAQHFLARKISHLEFPNDSQVLGKKCMQQIVFHKMLSMTHVRFLPFHSVSLWTVTILNLHFVDVSMTSCLLTDSEETLRLVSVKL